MVLPSVEKEWQLAQTCWPSSRRWLAGLADIAQPPCDQGHAGVGERLDHALFQFGRHQRHVAIKDRRAHGVAGRGEGHSAARNRVMPGAVAKTGNCYFGRGVRGAFLDLRPHGCIGRPGACGRLERRELGRFVGVGNGARVDLPETHAITRAGGAEDAARGELHFDLPGRRVFPGIAEQERGRSDFRRKDRAFGGIVDGDDYIP